MIDNFEEVVDFANSQGGWTGYVWGKIGLINGFSLLGNDIREPGDNRVIYQDISTCVVHHHPPKNDYLNLSTIQGRSLDNLQFDFFYTKNMLLQ